MGRQRLPLPSTRTIVNPSEVKIDVLRHTAYDKLQIAFEGKLHKFSKVSTSFWLTHASMDDSSYRLNFDLGKKNEIHHHS